MQRIARICLVGLCVLSAQLAFGQLLVENFDYGGTDNSDIRAVAIVGSDTVWTRHSGTQGPAYKAAGLSYTGYVSSGIGGSAWFTRGSGGVNDGDVHRRLSSAVSSTSNVYAAFMVKVDSAHTGGEYFFHFGPQTIGTTFRGRVFGRAEGTGWVIGLSKSSEAAVYSTTVLNFGQTYLVVVKYSFSTATTSDDVVTLYLYSSGVPASEPGSPLVTVGPVGAGTTGDPADIGTVAIRQASTATTGSPTGYIDGIRVGTSWNDVLGSAPATAQVTFRLNTATAPKLITDSSKVQVRGSAPQLGPWGDAPNNANQMTNIGSSDYWTFTATFNVGDTVYYKFYAEDWEDGDDYRLIVGGDTTLPLRYFRKQGFGPGAPYTTSDSVDVWFRVYIYNIDGYTDADTVGIRGGTAPLDWGVTYFLKKEPDNVNMWSGVVRFPPAAIGSTVEYKFVIGSGPKRWESIENRTYVVHNDTTLRWTTFDRKTLAAAKNVSVLFSVNISVMEFQGVFKPQRGDVVLVRGSFNGWGETDVLAPSAIRSGIWEKVRTINAAPGDFIEFKYYMKAGDGNQDHFDNGGWEAGTNRRHVFTDADEQDVAEDYFDRVSPERTVQKEEGVEVHFFCDMNNVTDKAGTPITRVDSLFIAGSHAPLFWIWDHQTRDRSGVRLKDDGVYPDKVAGDNIWSVRIIFPKWTSKGPIQFKFAANGISDAASDGGFQEDHILFMDDLPDQPGVRAVNETEVIRFGRQNGLGAFRDTVRIVAKRVVTNVEQIDGMPLVFELGQNYPNPFNPTTTIHYSIANESHVTLTVFNMLGQEVATLVNEQQRSGNYKVTFSPSNLPSGVYLYRLKAGSFVDVKKLVLLK